MTYCNNLINQYDHDYYNHQDQMFCKKYYCCTVEPPCPHSRGVCRNSNFCCPPWLYCSYFGPDKRKQRVENVLNCNREIPSTVPDVPVDDQGPDMLTLAFCLGLSLFFFVILVKCAYEYFVANFRILRHGDEGQLQARNQIELANQRSDILPSYVELCHNDETPMLRVDEMCDDSPPPYETVLVGDTSRCEGIVVSDASPLQPDSHADDKTVNE